MFHDLLATATLCVTDGQSAAAEAAVLGVPSLRLSGFTGRVWYLDLLERAGLTRTFHSREETALVDALRTALTGGAGDVAGWFIDLAAELSAAPAARTNPGPERTLSRRDRTTRAPAAAEAGGR